MLNVGDQAPDFKLTTLGADGPAFVTLSENAGKSNTLVLFFSFFFTGVCTQEFCDLTASLNDYASLNAEVIGISGDNPFAQSAWAEKEGIKVTLASDYEHDVANAYGIAYDAFLPDKNLEMGGVPKRSASSRIGTLAQLFRMLGKRGKRLAVVERKAIRSRGFVVAAAERQIEQLERLL